MALTPDQHSKMEESSVLDGERIVISGMAGLFPQARHVKELAEILYDKVILMGITPIHRPTSLIPFIPLLDTSFH